ncbi:MAG TPA: hypothetical protein VH419_05355 [Nocardioidaceae bacterium]|jgi:hypothetical protein
MSTTIRVRIDSVVLPSAADDRVASDVMAGVLVAGGLPEDLGPRVAERLVADLRAAVEGGGTSRRREPR